MPPKKEGPSKKNEAKKKERTIEDKTFGLKNKKGSKQQKFIQHVEKQVKCGNVKTSKLNELTQAGKKKEDKKKEQDELNMLFRPVQTVGKGADPKSVLCAFFKQGQCSKGSKCKFSHDLGVERKGEKRNIYEDKSEDKETVEDWDETKLQEVVEKKHGATNKQKMETAIICKFFLEAVENGKYGWFWACPNGADKCHYRHCLPPGFVLKKDKKKESEEDQITIEELIEKERAALGANVTRVTYETFIKWKERKRNEKIEIAREAKDKKKSDFKAGKMLGITGRDMFEFNPDLIGMDDDEADEGMIERERDEDDDDEIVVQEINLESFDNYVGKGDATVAPESRVPMTNGVVRNNDEESKLNEAGALPPKNNMSDTDAAIAVAMAANMNGDIEIDEDLFDGEDLDQIEEDLETLDLDE
ncbi:zinc finger CCCH domain-containing protein 15-like [Mytilus californianus]|uniref:zinc finger CCCH domain-containing protein 15-like n=1 Tax=Mytilus californianus TaxID=6549 RepID=UPI0022480ECB|nr:zinc finger CCCH domain-containing protein 15-like [Mytilus californianus]